MAFHARSYFAGVATVLGTVALGFGGGIVMTKAMIGASDTTANHLERRSADNVPPPSAVVAASPYRDDAAQPKSGPSPSGIPWHEGVTTGLAPATESTSDASTASSQTAAQAPANDKAARPIKEVVTTANGVPVVDASNQPAPAPAQTQGDNSNQGNVAKADTTKVDTTKADSAKTAKADANARAQFADTRRVAANKRRTDRRQAAGQAKQRNVDELDATAEAVRQIAPEPAQETEVKSSPFGWFN